MLNKRILVLIFLLVFLPLVGCFPQNHAPIITSIPVTDVTEGETYVYDVEATDPDGDTLTYSLTVKPTGMTIDPATGLIKWTPKTEGNYAVVVKVSDGALDIIQSLTIMVTKPSAPPPVNHAPIITSTPNLATVVGIQYTYTVEATDPDGNILTYSLTTYPSGMTISSTTGVISWIPNATGNYDVAVKVSDGKKSDTQNFTITVKTVEIVGIVVLPETMTLVIGTSETIQSVTASYNIKADFEVPILLGDCTYLSDDINIATVSTDGVVTAVADGTATITVSYGGKTDTIAVTVTYLPMKIIADLPTFGVGVETEFTVEVVANSDVDKTVKFYFTLPTLPAEDYTVEILYLGDWWDLKIFIVEGEVVLGGADGDPLIDEIKDFKATFGTAGTYSITVEVRTYPGNLLLCSKDISAVVIDLVQNTDTGEYYHTIQAAINDGPTLDGHTIEVAAGTYNEQVTIDKQLTLNGANANESIIDGEGTTAVIISANNVTIDGFTLDGGITLDDLLDTISGGTISNNIITGADNPVNPPKAENGIRLGWDNGIGVDYITIENNIIKNSLCKGIRFACSNKYASWGGTTPGNSYITICNNEIKDNGSAGMETYGPGPNFITGNTISGNDGNGINLKFDNSDVVTGNIITNNTGPGITLRGVANSIVENNSISDHRSENMFKNSDVIGGKGSGIHIIMVSKGNTIRFNDISENNYGIFIRKKNDLQPSDNSINHNNIVGNSYYGILNDLVNPPIPADATRNWWGSEFGPKHDGWPADGGDSVSDNVDYENFLSSEY